MSAKQGETDESGQQPWDYWRQWTAARQVIVVGSFLVFDEAHNHFCACFPDRAVFKHREDIPTPVENCHDTNKTIVCTRRPVISVAQCLKMRRTDTRRRFAETVDSFLAGSRFGIYQTSHRPRGNRGAPVMPARRLAAARDANMAELSSRCGFPKRITAVRGS